MLNKDIPNAAPESHAITGDLLREALKTGHEECEHAGPDRTHNCVHAEAVGEASAEVDADIQIGLITSGGDPFAVWYAGFHAGYRLHQLLTTATPKDKVN